MLKRGEFFVGKSSSVSGARAAGELGARINLTRAQNRRARDGVWRGDCGRTAARFIHYVCAIDVEKGDSAAGRQSGTHTSG